MVLRQNGNQEPHLYHTPPRHGNDKGGGARHDKQPAPTLTLWMYGLILPSNSYTDFIKQIIVVNREDFLPMKICKYSGLIVQVNNSLKRT